MSVWSVIGVACVYAILDIAIDATTTMLRDRARARVMDLASKAASFAIAAALWRVAPIVASGVLVWAVSHVVFFVYVVTGADRMLIGAGKDHP